jgi:hypothetical protein
MAAIMVSGLGLPTDAASPHPDPRCFAIEIPDAVCEPKLGPGQPVTQVCREAGVDPALLGDGLFDLADWDRTQEKVGFLLAGQREFGHWRTARAPGRTKADRVILESPNLL